MWPSYSSECRKDVDGLLRRGGSLSAYKANPQVGVEPSRDSWAWRLEREVETRFGVKHAVACNSGTGALHSAIAASLAECGASSGDVVVSPYTFSASAAAILHAGYTPVFADVDPYTFNITPETVKKVLTRKTVGIVPVSLFGGMADVRGLKRFGLPVIEDAAQAVGARNADGYSGSQAIAAMYSMNGGKNVPAGECGVAVTNSHKISNRMRLLGNHGENFHQKQVGYNFRPNEVTACIAWHGLQELEERNQRRRELARALPDRVEKDGGYLDVCGPRLDHVFYVFPLVLEKFPRPLFIRRMAKRGIPVGEGYITPPLHKYPAFRQYQTVPMPVVEELSSKTLCILSTLTPDRPLSYARKVAEAMRESLR